jgi:uncharacterized protein (TIGR02118 family)
MYSVQIMYPKTDDSTFDMDYYMSSHMPMVAEALGDACQAWGAVAVTSGQYEAIGWVTVNSEDAWNAALAAKGGDIMADIPNYTNTTPDLVTGTVAPTP